MSNLKRQARVMVLAKALGIEEQVSIQYLVAETIALIAQQWPVCVMQKPNGRWVVVRTQDIAMVSADDGAECLFDAVYEAYDKLNADKSIRPWPLNQEPVAG